MNVSEKSRRWLVEIILLRFYRLVHCNYPVYAIRLKVSDDEMSIENAILSEKLLMSCQSINRASVYSSI